ncbi:hypothetical protein TUBRATIS_004580 [Tubulinosema ratisbonensis]|uniref:Uncharacterized protein n=1 Tax=Tubulinosema ratisbonensis TaxID=291195 RepID=A0A437AP56_9MICR|nr:hypothetical protein TUBRATIS_004580 [Tubulinosema ratisbonensis]
MTRILFLIPLYSLRNIIFYPDLERINKLKGECVVFNQEMNSLSLKYDLDLETKNKLHSKIQLIEAKVSYHITSICNKVRDINLEQFYVLIDHGIENLFRELEYDVDY